MGTVKFDSTPIAVTIVTGQPHFACGQIGTEFSRENTQRNYQPVPTDLQRIYRAMQLATPPEGVVVAGAGQLGLKARIAEIFGSGQRGSTNTEWCPTDLSVEGVRAWTRHQRWQEGGGDGWIGSPIYHDWVVAGAFLHEEGLRQWANQLFQHPLGAALEEDGGYAYAVYFPYYADSAPDQWEGVEVLEMGWEFVKEDDFSVQNGKAVAGVYRTYKVRWELWSGTVAIHQPHLWWINREWESHYPVNYNFLAARNGQEERRFVFPGGDYPEKGEFGSLPEQPAWASPTEASGEWATFWASEDAWEEFALTWNIWAEKVRLGIHAPISGEPGGMLVPLTREWAENAWASGATPLPEVIGEVPPTDQWDRRVEDGFHRSAILVGVAKATGYGAPGEVNTIHLVEGGGNCQRYIAGWVRVPSDRQAAYPYGLTVRDPGDQIRGDREIAITTDGWVIR